MAAGNKFYFMILFLFLLLGLYPAAVIAQTSGADELKPEESPPKTRQIVIVVIDGLQADSLNATGMPNANGLGMAGIRVDRVSTMPPDNSEARLYSILCGTDPGDHGFTGSGSEPKISTIMSYMEKKEIKTALIDGTGKMEISGRDVTYKNFGPFKNDQEVMTAALDVIKNKKPFLSVVVLAGPGPVVAPQGSGAKAYLSSVAAADNEVGRFLKQMHMDGTYEDTLMIITGTTGKPPLVIRGNEFVNGQKLSPISLKDIAPTLGYLNGIKLSQAKGLILWNAFRPGVDRTEKFMLMQRVNDLSSAYAEAMDISSRLEGEKILVQEEKARLSLEKQSVEREISERDNHIKRLTRIISIMKYTGLLGIVIFVVALIIEYRILKKRYLFFT